MPFRSMLPDLWRGERALGNPFREFGRLQRRMDRLFDELIGEQPMGFEQGEFLPACDIEETQSNYLLSFDLPGVKKDDVKIEVHDHELLISGERKEEEKSSRQGGRADRERYYGFFSRSFSLPSNVKSEEIEANFENGVLQIAIPKSEVPAGKQIPIKEGKRIEAKKAA